MAIAVALSSTAVSRPGVAQGCPQVAEPLVSVGWDAYRADQFERADTLFRRAVGLCPRAVSARTALGYSAMRLGRADESRLIFQGVLDVDSSVVDALVGLALVAWLNGEVENARAGFRRVLRVEPQNTTALQYLGTMPPGGPSRPPLILPDTVVYRVRAARDRFEIRSDDGWSPFYVKGVNVGAALPGRFPSQFPDSATYARWIQQIADMGANTVRLYTIHPPHFYGALWAYNTAHPEAPLWLIHGVWAELPPDYEYDDPNWEGEFFREMRWVVDVVHGRADLPRRPGHAAGRYLADVSPWTLAFIVGREWEPFSVDVYNRRAPRQTDWLGRYIELRDGSPIEAWLAKACEQIVAYETETYRHQRPVAYTNWPTLDPIYHRTETTAEEEVAIRRALGERFAAQPLEYDNDAAGLDARRMQPLENFPAGIFAAFHVYPYYPDFMVLDPDYRQVESAEGASSYYGYLRDLKAHHPTVPVLIAEYGVPASLGSAHLQPQGWHHGGHTEQRMAEIDGRLTREIAEAGMAGGVVFAWIDEWFKRNWLTADFEIPRDRGRLWHNRLDAEQHYGMVAMDAEPRLPGRTLAERLPSWELVPPLYQKEGAALRAAADEESIWLLFDPGGKAFERVFIGFDMVNPAAGDVRWPGGSGPLIPVGVEFVLQIGGDEARVMADPPSNPFRMQPVRDTVPTDFFFTPGIASPPPGFFTGRIEQRFKPRYVTEPNDDGRYDSLRVVTNRPRFGRDAREYAGLGYDRGVLPEGPPPDGLWERHAETGVIEARIPWALLNVTDPSQRRVLQHDPETPRGALSTTRVRSIGIVAAGTDSLGRWSFWPAQASADSVARYTWASWDTPRWRERRRPVYEEMRRTFLTLEPAVVKFR